MLLSFDNLTLGYEAHPAVHHLTYGVHQGALVALIGPNGAGKSTLLKGIMGQVQPLDGQIHLHGIDRSFPITVQELVALGAWKEIGAFGRLQQNHKEQVAYALQQLNLSGFEKRLISSLSGGQMQRVLFARLLVQNARLILLDEPFTGVDSRTTHDLLHMITAWHKQGKTIIAVLHDLDQVRKHFPECLLLSREPIAFGVTKDVLTEENWLRARQLNEAFDEHAVYCGSHETP
jgi:zinc/manganese transport system ATP-binding protein